MTLKQFPLLYIVNSLCYAAMTSYTFVLLIRDLNGLFRSKFGMSEIRRERERVQIEFLSMCQCIQCKDILTHLEELILELFLSYRIKIFTSNPLFIDDLVFQKRSYPSYSDCAVMNRM